ncbi:MAG: cation:dicarboxylase symporter family transporter [Eubacteriales bacterium]|nr:cation:dicarboxylase symporter family transporter [Eubacteriales bacterium]
MPKLIIAIIIGILIGAFMPEWFCRLVVTASGIFSMFLKFIIPLMILSFVTMGIADLTQGADKLLLITVIIAYASTLIFGSASYLISAGLFPSFMSPNALPFLYMIFGIEAGDPNGPICAIMVALYITQDSFGTACNVSGDNAIGVIVDTIYKRHIIGGKPIDKQWICD